MVAQKTSLKKKSQQAGELMRLSQCYANGSEAKFYRGMKLISKTHYIRDNKISQWNGFIYEFYH